jgi:hypothetical protein
MVPQTLCAEVARRLGEPLQLVRGRGFQPLRRSKKSAGPALAAADCPFCGRQVVVAAKSKDAVEAECRSCDTAFLAEATDVYQVSLAAAERPAPRRFPHERC